MTVEIIDQCIGGKLGAAGGPSPGGNGVAQRLRDALPAVLAAHINALQKRDRRRFATIDVIVPQCRFSKTDGMTGRIDCEKRNGIFIGRKLRELRSMTFERTIGPKLCAQAHPIVQMFLCCFFYPHVSPPLACRPPARTKNFTFDSTIIALHIALAHAKTIR